MSRPPAAGDALVRVEALVKRFPRRRSWSETLRHPLHVERIEVLRGISLEVRRGEFFGLLGPNGAGKTTLFKILATLVLPESGAVSVAGIDALADPSAVRALLTPVIADERSLNWRLTAPENLRLFAALHGIPAGERAPMIQGLLERVGLGTASGRMVGTFSSGMRQRLLIARALLSRPSVLLLDEPTRSLDPVSARDFRRFLREEIVGRQGCTVLLATHDADEAFELCDRLAVLDRGSIVAHGTVAELSNLAGERRYRILVGAACAAAAGALLEDAGLPPFAQSDDSEQGWVFLEGEIPGGPAAAAEMARRLVGGGIAVGEFARVPVSLADLIEGLVRKGGAA
jgi:ABC-2 type transport system ATP-binding protein